LDSISSSTAPSILVVESDPDLRELIARTLGQAGYDAVLAPCGSGEAALDLISAADFDGLYCEVQLPGQVDGWDVGATFSFVWPDKPTVYASAFVAGPPGRLRKGIFLRRSFGLDRLVTVFETSAIAAPARQALA
jgi:DNA-binding NtrC family response regulator